MDTQKDQAKSSSLFDQLIDQYKLEAHINQTAVTDLYRAFDVDENRPVAIEVLLPIFNNKKQFVDQFIEKMNKVSQIKHPNIAQVYQIGITPNNRPYVARDLVEGITLRERLQQLSQQTTPANSIYALKIIRQLAEALELAERLDLYHYFLSPDNIQLKQDGTVVLVDLGIPALENGTAVKAEIAPNSPYIAPEIQQGKPVNSRSQIYSLGVILHEILVGKLPEEPNSVWHSFSQVIRPQNTVLEQARPDLARQTYELIDKSLLKQPWARFSSITEFLEAINEALQNERMLVQTRGEKAVLTPPPPRRSRLVLLLPLLALVIAVVGVAVWSLTQMPTSEDPTSQPIAVDNSSTNTQIPTPTLLTTSATLPEPTVDTAVATDPLATNEPTADDNPFTLLAPADSAAFNAGDIGEFRWNWSGSLAANQQFSVYLITGNGRSLLGSVEASEAVKTYTLQATLPDTGGNAMVQWTIVLEDLVTNRDVVSSDDRNIIIQTPLATATFTPAPTEPPTATFTPSPTPIPQVEIIVSSASLRQGPDVVYPILRYLFEGDIVGVIGQEGPDGNWYNVVLADGSRGWVTAEACRWVDEASSSDVPIAATIPVRPTNTPTPTPTNTPTPTFTPTPVPSGGNPQPPTNTPAPTVPPLPTP
ncbi:MAG: serine/threonine protein kinase [Chloroflexota bacterium]